MADPITLGGMAASALALAGEAFLKGVVGEAAKHAYTALKDKIAPWVGNDVEALEKTPTSTARQMVVAETLDRLSADEQAAFRELAGRLIAALRASGPIGIDIGRLDALEAKLGAITVTAGIGVRIGDASVRGTFETGEIRVGPDAGKK